MVDAHTAAVVLQVATGVWPFHASSVVLLSRTPHALCSCKAARLDGCFTCVACVGCGGCCCLQFKTEPKSGEVVGLFGVFDGEGPGTRMQRHMPATLCW